ncbi:MAG: site-specific integrase [Methanobrevibacter sp.]|uniref:site-specific integrase n=1 Tax=Methanobrevibacter sp. TaxID=66852 RepID=UPI0025CEB45E|nr:site-specific integrase [Methanobrevibacter sp.]MBQ6099048.1 site-specific integrase [Methanobrevibacter sp.]
MNMNNHEILQEFFIVKGHKGKTQETYLRAINNYSKFQGLTMQELIEEAETEEDNNIIWKRRKLKKRLLNYRSYLIANYKKNTVNTYFTQVTAVYKYFEIEIGNLTRANPRSYKTPGEVTFDELPTHEELSQVLHVAKLWFQAALLFMTSSGCARKETIEMTVGQFKKATYPFHKKNDIVEALHVLKDMNNVIPTFKLKRKKTNKHYYTFCSPEAVSKIVEYLLNDRIETLEDGSLKLIHLNDDDKLFDRAENYLPVAFYRYNDEFNFGVASDGFNRFRSHMMRKFHSNHLRKSGMSESDIDALQGRSKTTTHAAYFLDDPTVLLKKYVEHFSCLVIEANVNNIDFKSPEYQELERKYHEKEEEIVHMEDRLSSIEERLADIDQRPQSRESILKKISESSR